MRISHLLLALVAVLLAFLLVPTLAAAAPDATASGIINEDDGFPGICTAPCFSVQKDAEVYFDGNATGPGVCAPGENTYVYTLTHLGPANPIFAPFTGAPINKFELEVDFTTVSSAGAIPGPGVAPSATTVNPLNVVTWDFLAPAIDVGQTSQQLYVCSTLLPGMVGDNMVSADGPIGLDAPGDCLGPFVEPTDPGGTPAPCTIGYWKNRADGKQGTLQHFPDPEFDQVVSAAVLLSGGVFADEAALLADLGSKGKRPIEQRARQQFAAVLLDLAAGDLFTEDKKCQLFDPNVITTNACGDNLTIAQAVAQIIAWLDSGDPDLAHEAAECADDINNGISVGE